MRYQVFENDKPCDYNNFHVHSSWNSSIFNTLEEAIEYANKWLGSYAPDELDEVFKLNEKFYYYDEDFVVIREVE